MDQTIARPIRKKKKEKTQVTNFRNYSGTITRGLTGTKGPVKEHHEQLYPNKFDNSDKMDQFFERHGSFNK